MLSIKTIYKLQSEYSVADESFKDSEVTYDEYISQCRAYLTSNLPPEYIHGGWDAEKKQSVLINLASKFIEDHPVKVKGYVTKEGIVDTEHLLESVIDSVTGASILREALEDPDIDEIQINDHKTIYVIRNGIPEYYVSKTGKVLQFSSDDEVRIVINKLIDDGTGNLPQFTDGNPILNAKTAKEQYRINAVHPVVNTMDKPPNSFPITTLTLRKFKDVKLSIEDLIKFKAVTPKMGRFLMLLGRAELKLFCVGPTASGKTTLLNIIANTIPLETRILLAQNPTEISFQERDEYGRNKRNVVHWEVTSVVQLSQLIDNTLRSTPDVIIVGEAREKDEFFQILRAMRTGHRVLGTFHAEDANDAVGRFATEISSASGTSYSESVRLVADTLDIIVSQYKFPDGTRRVMEISEIQGVDDKGEPIINKLFEFKMTGEVKMVGEGDNAKPVVLGDFVHVGTLSDKLVNSFYKAGISKKEIQEFLEISDEGMNFEDSNGDDKS